MTLDQWIQKSGAILAKARSLESWLVERSLVARDAGKEEKADYLLGLASRVKPSALLAVEMITPSRMVVPR